MRRVPSIPLLSPLLIRASRWFDRCPPQRELSSKNGLTLETWIFIFSDNCTVSGHIRQGLMRNRLRLRAASLTQSEVRWREVWSRHQDKDERRIKMKILNTAHLPQFFDLNIQEVSDKMMLWWFTTRSGSPIKVTPCRWQNRNFLIFTRIRTHANPCIDSYHDIFNLSGYPQPTAAEDTWDYHKISP